MSSINGRIIEFRRTWGGGDEKEFAAFKTRLVSRLDVHFFFSIADPDGVLATYHHVLAMPYTRAGGSSLMQHLKASQLFQEFSKAVGDSMDGRSLALTIYALMLGLEATPHPQNQQALERLVAVVMDCSELSPNVGLQVARRQGHYTLFPRGAELLDEAVIVPNLAWLERYPEAAKAFAEALASYGASHARAYRNVLDNLRFSLEQVLKSVLGNDRPLEKQKDEVLPWLEERGVHKQTINLFANLLLGPFLRFQNDAVKHGWQFVDSEVEFYIYLTGTFLRLLLTLDREQG